MRMFDEVKRIKEIEGDAARMVAASAFFVENGDALLGMLARWEDVEKKGWVMFIIHSYLEDQHNFLLGLEAGLEGNYGPMERAAIDGTRKQIEKTMGLIDTLRRAGIETIVAGSEDDDN